LRLQIIIVMIII